MIKQILIFILVLMTFSCAKKTPEFQINGTISENLNIENEVVLITQTKEKIDTVTVHNGKFNFNGIVSEPTKSALIINGKIFEFPLVNDIINIKITGLTPTDFNVQYKNSIVAENLNNYFKKNAKTFSDNYKELIAQEVKSQTDAERMNVSIEQDSLIQHFLDNTITKYSNKNNIDGLNIIVADLKSFFGTRNYPQKIEQLYNLLPQNQKNGFYGKKIQTYLDQAYKIKVGQNVDFSFTDINNKDWELNDFKGKFVLLEFWASWCGPCIAQIPFLKKINQSDKIVILSITIDENISKWKNKVSELDMDWINLHYKQEENLKEKFFVNGVPYNILLSQNGKILKKQITMSELSELVK